MPLHSAPITINTRDLEIDLNRSTGSAFSRRNRRSTRPALAATGFKVRARLVTRNQEAQSLCRTTGDLSACW